jgi:hypothetical protein
MMSDDTEERQLSGLIDVLVPFTSALFGCTWSHPNKRPLALTESPGAPRRTSTAPR